MNYIQSFNRYEKKYLLSSAQYERLMEEAGKIIAPDSYGKHTICNIYLDTEDYFFIRNSIEKPVYKEKLRIRSYGIPGSDSKVFLEIKKKFKGVVYKRRISAKESDIMDYVLNGNISEEMAENVNPQILSEIDYIMRSYSPVPKLYLAYDRQAFIGIGNPELRVTFDSRIRSRTDELLLSAGDSGTLLDVRLLNENRELFTDESYRLMEIKINGAMPIEMARLLSELKIYPVSFSKYGEIYKKMITAERSISAAI